MNVLVTGSHGLIGTALIHALQLRQHSVRRLVRREATGHDVVWDIPSRFVDATKLTGVDAVVHLAGEGIAARRWSERQKRELVSSREDGTRLLADTLAGLDEPPGVLVSASAIGWYGERGDEELTEDSMSGDDFLADLCRRWEGATEAASAAGIRVVTIRTGIVLSARGGALKKQLPLFRSGLGGRLGSGRQWMSWISIGDEVGGILHALDRGSVQGPVNLVAPNPVTNAEFTKQLGKALRRPAVLPVPRPALRVVLGRELADSLLSSQRVVPTRLQETGYEFRHRDIEAALKYVLTGA